MTDAPKLSPQVVGRMGELAVEMELLARGWTVGNFNATTKNTAGFDLFAVKGPHDVKIRSKAKQRGRDSWQWSAKPDGTLFLNLSPRDITDFTVLISFDESPVGYTAYVLPTRELNKVLQRGFKDYCERNPTLRDDKTPRNTETHRHRALWLDSPTRGYAKKWDRYRDAWELLEAPKRGR